MMMYLVQPSNMGVYQQKQLDFHEFTMTAVLTERVSCNEPAIVNAFSWGRTIK